MKPFEGKTFIFPFGRQKLASYSMTTPSQNVRKGITDATTIEKREKTDNF